MESTSTTEQLLRSNKKWKYVRTDRNNTRYFADYTCNRCGGRGGWEGWPGFVCYDCGGSGVSDKPTVIKVYTPEYAEKLAAQRKVRADKAQAERVAKWIAERPENLIKAGFGKEGDEYVIYRVIGDTFSIKDSLKAAGCKYQPCVGWYAAAPLEGYDCQRLRECEVLNDTPRVDWKDIKDVKCLWHETLHPAHAASEWQGNVGDRLTLTLHVDRALQYEHPAYGRPYMMTSSMLYLMSDAAGNVYKWSTTKALTENADVQLRGTVKEHVEYKGIKQTVLTRCAQIS